MTAGPLTWLTRLAYPAGPKPRGPAGAIASRLLEWLYRPDRRLVVYGSLAPGRSNHHELAELDGRWTRGVIHGHLQDRGWGAGLGYPALRWDPAGEPVEAWVLSTPALERHWDRLDAFEGDEYARRVVPVFRDGRLACVAQCYLAAE